MRETTIRAGVAGIAGGFALATIFLAFTPYRAGVACGVFLAVVYAVALAILCAPRDPARGKDPAHARLTEPVALTC
ncbi:hypothetical protein [Rhodococcus sp. IEGM 1318]|uniref:hypothetical protein n=1 Tax=Rhodococcus sp. IEGM 1318 TaxID=3082226 RepID=UPI002954ABC1|nr:hypothetical protein [Rhodococcus sp. IEGM 1318]MDV8009321.1 hypothetical protein [Rhodococcus sp. IEGM 1318]